MVLASLHDESTYAWQQLTQAGQVSDKAHLPLATAAADVLGAMRYLGAGDGEVLLLAADHDGALLERWIRHLRVFMLDEDEAAALTRLRDLHQAVNADALLNLITDMFHHPELA